MKGKVRLKIIAIFLMVAGVNCADFLDELKVSLVRLQDTVDKISLEQIKTNQKVDQLEEKIGKLGTKVIKVEDLNETNKKIFDAFEELKNKINTFTQAKHSGNGCTGTKANIANDNQNETNLTEDHVEDYVAKEEKGKNIIYLSIYELGKGSNKFFQV